jgi:hypothetical protein
MIPYIGPELVEALKPLAADKLAKYTSADVSPKPLARKKKDHLTPLGRVTARLRYLIVAVVNSKLIILLVHACL